MNIENYSTVIIIFIAFILTIAAGYSVYRELKRQNEDFANRIINNLTAHEQKPPKAPSPMTDNQTKKSTFGKIVKRIFKRPYGYFLFFGAVITVILLAAFIAVYQSNSFRGTFMEEIFSVIIIILIIVGITLAIPAYYIYTMIKTRIANEKKAREEKTRAEAEAERKRKSKCCICHNPSMGYVVCNDCMERSKVLMKELPQDKLLSYDHIHHYREELEQQVKNPATPFEKKSNSVKLLSVANILKTKYYENDAVEKTCWFLVELNNTKPYVQNGPKITDQPETTDTASEQTAEQPREEPKEQPQTNPPKDEWDYRNRYPKNYRCEDGDYVRSKAEREIDDFLYRNRIWHVYESEYICMENGWKYYPDFYLPDYNLYIEYFGRDDKKYREKRDQKIKMYTADENVNFVWLDAKDDANITERLTEICKQYNIFGTEKKTRSFHT